jgi:Glycosyl hydrolase family 3 N terminal domain
VYDLVMSAHIVFSAYDDAPATLSHRVLTGLLREALQLLLEGHDGETFVLCTGMPEDRAIVPAGRNLVVLEAVATALTRRWKSR